LVNHRLRAGTSARPAGRRPVGAPGRALARSACRLLALLGGLALVVGCASYTEETREIRSLYKAEAYREALDKLDATDIKEQSRNRLLYRLEKAMILDRLGEGKRARTLLIY
jgi:hypothetical protein